MCELHIMRSADPDFCFGLHDPGSAFRKLQHIGSCRLCSEDFCRETNAAKGNLAVALLAIVVAFCTDSRGYEFGNELVKLFENLFGYSYWYMSWI